MYGEDIDLCYRIKQDNWKIFYFGEAKITHFKGASSKKQKSKLIYEFYRAMYIYYKNIMQTALHFCQFYCLFGNCLFMHFKIDFKFL